MTQGTQAVDKHMEFLSNDKTSCTLKIRGGVERDSQGKKAGKGPLIQWEKSATLGVSQDQTLFVWKAMDTDHLILEMDGE